MQKRFGDGLQVSIDIPEAYSDRLIIPAAIQMLIENAIKHNVVSRNRPLHISLHANGNNSIVITNNLQVKQSTEPSTGIGLRNIMKRYELVSDREVGIMKNESGFTVTLPLINPN